MSSETKVVTPPMTRAMMGRCWRRYQSLDGDLSRQSYEAAVRAFLDHTWSAYIGGEGDRQVAWARYVRWLARTHPHESPSRIFASVDDVQPYT